MKILSLNSFWQLFNRIAIFMTVCAVVHTGVPLPVICFFLPAWLAFKTVFRLLILTGIIIRIVMMFIVILLLAILIF